MVHPIDLASLTNFSSENRYLKPEFMDSPKTVPDISAKSWNVLGVYPKGNDHFVISTSISIKKKLLLLYFEIPYFKKISCSVLLVILVLILSFSICHIYKIY